MKLDVSLTEALTGMRKAVKTLDERTLVIQTVKGEAAPLASRLSPCIDDDQVNRFMRRLCHTGLPGMPYRATDLNSKRKS